MRPVLGTLLLATLAAFPAEAGHFAVIASLGGGNGAPAQPEATLLPVANGLVGTSLTGGANNLGSVFLVQPGARLGSPATVTVLYSFGATTADGRNPEAPLIADKAGNLYGTTAGGGANAAGTVFELSPPAVAGGPWTETVLYSFTGGSDGANPISGLAIDASGTLYGTTPRGGPPGCNLAGCGTAFSLAPPGTGGGAWSFTLLYGFTGTTKDGGAPTSPLLPGGGAFYGVTQYGGPYNLGTFYELAKGSDGWTATVLASFTGGPEGASPGGALVAGPGGTFYGTALDGGAGYGSIFIAEQGGGGLWSVIGLYDFTDGADGAFPVSGVTVDAKGDLLATTEGNIDASPPGYGSIVKLTVAQGIASEATLHDFSDKGDGATPRAAPVFYGHAYYGVTETGGKHRSGTVFVFTP